MVRLWQGYFPGDSASSLAPRLPPVLHSISDSSNKPLWEYWWTLQVIILFTLHSPLSSRYS